MLADAADSSDSDAANEAIMNQDVAAEDMVPAAEQEPSTEDASDSQAADSSASADAPSGDVLSGDAPAPTEAVPMDPEDIDEPGALSICDTAKICACDSSASRNEMHSMTWSQHAACLVASRVADSPGCALCRYAPPATPEACPLGTPPIYRGLR